MAVMYSSPRKNHMVAHFWSINLLVADAEKYMEGIYTNPQGEKSAEGIYMQISWSKF